MRLLNREWHSESLLRLAGRGGPLVAGAAFAIAWTPCTSITLGAILTQAAVSGSAAHGALLLAVYSAGLAIPFLLIALAFERMTDALSVVKRHFPVIIAIGGGVMIVLGVLIVTGEFTVLNARAQELTSELGLPSSSTCPRGQLGLGPGRRPVLTRRFARPARLPGAPDSAFPTPPGCAWRRARTASSRSP